MAANSPSMGSSGVRRLATPGSSRVGSVERATPASMLTRGASPDRRQLADLSRDSSSKVSLQVMDAFRKYGVVGVSALVLRKEFAEAVEMLRFICGNDK